MKKVLTLVVFGLFFVSMMSAVSAITVVTGIIYDNGVAIENAEISVSCNSNIAETASVEYGIYAVEYINEDCDSGDEVFVTATTDNGFAVGSGIVVDKNEHETTERSVSINLAIINVMVPEFGFLMGIFTLMSAVGIFFFVRKE